MISMRKYKVLPVLLAVAITLQSCEFSCSVGGKKEETKGNAVLKDGARVYNDIALTANKVKLSKAYLVLKDGTPMPEGNLVDFTQPVLLRLLVDEGWVNENGRVMLGAAEKITAEDGSVLLDEADMFAEGYEDGISTEDAKQISLSASIKLKKEMPPATFTVSFRVWDKKGEGYVEGSYKLYSK
jgi:hypothetical protein